MSLAVSPRTESHVAYHLFNMVATLSEHNDYHDDSLFPAARRGIQKKKRRKEEGEDYLRTPMPRYRHSDNYSRLIRSPDRFYLRDTCRS